MPTFDIYCRYRDGKFTWLRGLGVVPTARYLDMQEVTVRELFGATLTFADGTMVTVSRCGTEGGDL